MSNNRDDFNRSHKFGEIGEKWEFIRPAIKKCSMGCFRMEGITQCPRVRETQVEHTGAKNAVVDVDYVLSRNCEGCAIFDKLPNPKQPIAKQTHEVKTEQTACDKSTKKGSKAERTHNIYIELIADLEEYKKNEKLTGHNLKTGETYEYIKGIGWFNKQGLGPENKADWYHFYQPIDAYLSAGEASTGYFHRLAENDGIISEWLRDNSIPENSILMSMYPVSVVISVRGSKLFDLLKMLNNSKVDKLKILEEGEYKTACLLPVSKLIPCRITTWKKGNLQNVLYTGRVKQLFDEYSKIKGIRQVKYPDIETTKGMEGAIISLVGEYITRSGERIRGILPTGLLPYFPESIYVKERDRNHGFKIFRTENYEDGYWRGRENIPVEVHDFILGKEVYSGKGVKS